MNSFELFGTNMRGDAIGQQTKGTKRNFIDDIDAIAYGVEAWFEESAGYLEYVTEATVEIARRLGVPENEITGWVARRSTSNAQRVSPIKSILQRLYSSSSADKLKTGSINRVNLG